MPVRQFVLTLTIEETHTNSEGRVYNAYRSIEVDLVRGDIADFLAKIPDDLNDNASVMLALRRDDGSVIAFADGMAATSQGYGWEPVRRISSINDGRYADAIRQTAVLFADRRFLHEAEESDVPPDATQNTQ